MWGEKIRVRNLTACSIRYLTGWRRGRDSNPRYGYPYSAFRVRRDRPLCHLSVVATATSPVDGPLCIQRRQAKQERRRNDRDRRLDRDVQRIRRGRERAKA